MKRSYYQLHTKVNKDYYLHIGFMNNSFVLLNRELHDLYTNTEDVDSLKSQNPKLYNTLVEHGFIISDDFDELSYLEFKKKKSKFDRSLYHIVVNPTLDCNLSCWYCYEKKRANSAISPDVIEGIKKNIIAHDDKSPFRTQNYRSLEVNPFCNLMQ